MTQLLAEHDGTPQVSDREIAFGRRLPSTTSRAMEDESQQILTGVRNGTCVRIGNDVFSVQNIKKATKRHVTDAGKGLLSDLPSV
ncbi:MAG: hypothetical protein M3H12_20715 [Chromatiales bacterium]